MPLKKVETVAERGRDVGSCNERVADIDKFAQGPIESVLANEQKDGTDGRYGPWVVVTHKKNGKKSQSSGGVAMVQGSGQPQQLQKRSESGLRTSFAPRQIEPRSEVARETKRKLNGSAVDNVIQRIMKEPNQRAQGRLESSQKLKELD